jgi:DNA-3-methyladenine glycosylase II
MRRIETTEDIAEGLSALVALDPRLAPVVAAAGEVPLRRTQPGFASLASIIVSQQVSRASADAILARLTSLVDPLDARGIMAAGDDVMREAGLSRPKQKTLLAIARAVDGGLDLDRLAAADADDAMASLTALHGVGPWTAEVYLLFCAGHPDIFPAHDVALQSAVGHALAIEPRPAARVLYVLAESWAPWRGVAARLFWAYYREMKGREAAPPVAAVKKNSKNRLI